MGIYIKWQYQPEHRSRSWLATIRVQRLDISELLEDNPSLKPYLKEALQKAYLKGVELAVSETDLPSRTSPSEGPYDLAEILGDRFYSGEPSELVNELKQ
uniref:DUF29 domain-containing protein n=1 Tax=Trichocoleus desertorum TaxID=1481672 RepID=UPI0036F2BBF3